MIARRRLSHIGAAILLLAIVSLGAGLRLYRLDAQSVDGNEAFSILMSRLSLPAIAPELVKDVLHPPLYQYALHCWFAILGSTVLQARWLSALFGIAAVGMIYWLGAVT
jgi:mannosyltransferase